MGPYRANNYISDNGFALYNIRPVATYSESPVYFYYVHFHGGGFTMAFHGRNF